MLMRCARPCHWLAVLVYIISWLAIGSGQLVPAPPTSPASPDSYNSGSDNKLLCMAEMVSSIENSCSQSDIQGLYVALEALLKQYLEKCFNTNFTENRALHEIMPAINENVTDWLQAQADAFKIISGLEDNVPTFVPPLQVNAEVELMMQSNLANSYDGWILDPYVYGLVSKYSGFYALDNFVYNSSLDIEWDDVLPFVRDMHASYKGQIVALPIDVRIDLLFYRQDVLQKFFNSTQAPMSWTELLRMASVINGTDISGDGQADYGICIDVRADCDMQVNNVMGIAASMLQYAGTAQGIFFDPVTMPSGSPSSVLVSNPAFATALSIYTNLTRFAPPALPTDACTDQYMITKLFAAGRCAFIMGSRIFKNIEPTATPMVRGNVGVALLPGSHLVLDRVNNVTIPCTTTLCPFAVPDANGTLINRTPWSGEGGWVMSVNSRSTSNYMNLTVAFHAYVSEPDKSMAYVTNPVFDFEPYRQSHLTNISAWTAAGYNGNDTLQWLNMLGVAMDMSYSTSGAPGLGYNMAMDLRVPVTQYVRDLYVFAISNATLGVPLYNVTSTLASGVAKVLQDSQNVQASLAEIVDAYYSTIHFQLPPPPPAPPAPPGLGPANVKGGSPSWLPIAIILPVIGALLLVATGVMYEVRNKRKHKDLFGKVLPPKMAPDTSILYMDIQDVEALSAAVSGDVMAHAITEYSMAVHHVLNKHSGYESAHDPATGAFTIAFHSPKDAFLAGLEIQAALLAVSWPPELIALPQCSPVHVLDLSAETNEHRLHDILDPTESQVYSAGSSSVFTRFLFGGWRKRKENAAANPAGPENDANDLRLMGLGSAPAGPTIPALVNVPNGQTYSFATACQNTWKDVSATECNKVLIFKGLRIRMGIHAGVSNPEFIVESKEEKHKRTQYIGTPVQLATAVAHTAPGGMLLLSEDTYKKLPLERIWSRYLVIHVGEHNGLEGCVGSTNLYHALNRTLEGRLAHLSQIDTPTQLDTGVLDAPVGCVTVAFMHVVGAQTLLSWNADIAQAALKLFHSVVGDELKARRGYLVEAVDGLFLAAFLKPLNAVMWALECNDLMLKQKWSDELLMHELCEELVISSPTREGDVLNTVVFRGPRLKTGVDTGQVLGEVHAMTGRMTYRGKVMNRAARIASTASTGQVLCSADSWEMCQARDPAALQASKITSSTLGQFRLKGVAERIEIFHCRKAQVGSRVNRRGNSMVINITDKNRWNWEFTSPPPDAAPRGETVTTAAINVELALPATLDRDPIADAGSELGPEVHDDGCEEPELHHEPGRHLVGETEDDEPLDEDEDDDDDADDFVGHPFLPTKPPDDFSITSAHNSAK